MSKHDLRARPIYHRKRESIDAHLAIVFAALAISQRVEHLTGWTISRFVKTLRRYRSVQINTGSHTLTAEQPVPDDLRVALDQIHQRTGDQFEPTQVDESPLPRPNGVSIGINQRLQAPLDRYDLCLGRGKFVRVFLWVYLVLRLAGLVAALYTGHTLISQIAPPLTDQVPSWVVWVVKAAQTPESLLDLWMPADPIWNALILFGTSGILTLIVTVVLTRGGRLFLQDFLLRSAAYLMIGVILSSSLLGLVLIANLGWPLWLYVPVFLVGFLLFGLVGYIVDAAVEALGEIPLIGAKQRGA